MALQEYTGQQDNKHRQGKHHTHTHTGANIFRSTRNAEGKPTDHEIHCRNATLKAHIWNDLFRGKNLVSCHIVLY